MDQKRPLTFTTFMLRLFSGIVGGAAGTLALFIVYFLMSSLVPPSDAEGPSSLTMFVVIIMTFVGTLIANTVTGVMVTFMDNVKYSRRKTTIVHIFLFNLILFFVTIPLYLIGSASTLNIVNGVAAVHFLLSAFITALIMEVLAGAEYSLLGIYSTALGMFVSIAIALAMMAGGVRPISIMFAAMPGVWFILEIVSGFTELVYDNYVKLYGTDFLNIQTDLGGDKEIEKEEESEEDEEK